MRINIYLAISLLLLLLSCQQKDTYTTLEKFELDPIFQLTLVAAEPLVFDPVDMEFDEHGDAYVLEMPGYPFSDSDSRLILLKDNNDDGIFDERIVFADSLGIATSFMPHKGGMLVAAPPDLVWLKDNNGDGKADERQVIITGFAVDNLQHNYNGLTYGLDNWIYAANGGNDGEPYFIHQPETKIHLQGGDLKFHIPTQRLERFGESSGGFEFTFDQWGRLFENHNIEAISHLVFEDRYLAGLPVEPAHALTLICEPDETGYTRIYPTGEQETRVNHPEQSGYFSGACGITFYGGGAFPKPYNHQLFVVDVVLNLVHLGMLSPDGAAFKTTRKYDKSEFLASTERAFRPVNMTVGTDGALYVLDMHRTVIEHPEWIPDEIEATLDLDAGKQEGRIYRVTPKKNWKHQKISLKTDEPLALVKALESPNQWVRITAQRLMVERQEQSVVPLLEQCFVNTQAPLARLHAMWTLEGLQALSDSLLENALKDKTEGIRENAIKIVETRLHQSTEKWMNTLLELTSDEFPRVRMQAALAISTLSSTIYEEYAAKIGEKMFALLEHPETDKWITLAVIAAVHQQPQLFGHALLASHAPLNEKQQQVAHALAKLIGYQKDVNTAKDWLTHLKHTPTDLQSKLLEAIALGWSSSGNQIKNGLGALETSLIDLEKQNDLSVIRASAQLRQAMGLGVSTQMNQLITQALEEIKDQTRNQEERLAMLKLIGLAPYSQRANLLFEMLDNTQPIALQREALLQLWQSNQPKVGEQLLRRWTNLGAEARKHASDILLHNTNYHQPLLTAMENGLVNLGELNLDLERRRMLLFSDDIMVKKRAEALFSDAGVVKRQDAIEAMRPALMLLGQVAKGQEVYESLCSGCHRFGNIGHEVGPNLTEIQRKSKETLLYEILDPNAAVDTRYLTYKITTKNGSIHSGIIQKENDQEIVLRNIGGTTYTIQKKEMTNFSSLGVSFMPEGQEANMTHQDMADLLAFLQQSKEI